MNLFKRRRPLRDFVSDAYAYEPKPLAPAVERRVQVAKPVKPKSFLPQSSTTGFPSRTNLSKHGEPEYALGEMVTAKDVESIVARIFNRMEAVSWIQGFTFKSVNEDAKSYIERRLTEMALARNEHWVDTLQTAYSDLLTFGNAFLVKVRKAEASSGKQHMLYGDVLDPIAGIECISPVDMFPVRRKLPNGGYGELIRWKHIVEDRERSFAKSDVIHFRINRKTNHIFGTPLLVPVLDDIRSLRRNEEYVEIVGAKHAFPTYVYTVGTPDRPPVQTGQGISEIEEVDRQIQSMPPDGVFIIPGHHSIAPVEISESYVDSMPFINYWRERVITGMGASLLDIGLGETATRSTANNISQNLIDLMKFYQDQFERSLTFYLFNELLQESGGKYTLSSRDEVQFVFNEIDVELHQSQRNHTMALAQGGMLTMTEARREMGLRDLTDEDYNDMHLIKLVQKKDLEFEDVHAEHQIEAAKVAGEYQLKKAAQTKTNKSASTKNQPQNQHGTRKASATKKTRKDSEEVTHGTEG